MAANDRRKQGEGASAPSPAVEPATARRPMQPRPEQLAGVSVGDIVIYSHRRTGVGSDGKDYADIPMIVTRVYNSETIAGCALSESLTLCPNGWKPVDSVKRGDGGGKWRPRR